jgi:hypothetical protein
VFIRMSDHTYMSIYVLYFLKKIIFPRGSVRPSASNSTTNKDPCFCFVLQLTRAVVTRQLALLLSHVGHYNYIKLQVVLNANFFTVFQGKAQ